MIEAIPGNVLAAIVEAKPALLDTQTRAHHPDSPSSLQSSEACPGFLNEQRESEAAAKGTLQHKAAEVRDLTVLGGDEDMENAVTKCINYEDDIMAEFKQVGAGYEILREVKLRAADDDLTEGFPDTVIVGEYNAVICDWKFGRVAVTETKRNLQGMSYALGLFRLRPKLKQVTVIFYAPYQGWSKDAQRIKYVHTFAREDNPEMECRIRVVIARKHEAYKQIANGNWEMCVAKHDLCIWCARKALCPKVGQLVLRANEKYHDIEVPAVLKEWKLSTPQQVADAYRFANQLTTICDAVKKRCVEASLIEDLKPENFTLIKSAHRKVKSVRGFLRVARECGIPLREALEKLSVSFKPFEEALKAKAVKGKGAAALREFNGKLDESGITEKGTPFYFLREAKTPAEATAIE
jgi:hypothetical protein